MTTKSQNKKNRNVQKNRGFTLYYAVLFASMIITASMSTLSTTLKDFNLSNSLKESNIAFYAADTGAECVLYWDVYGGGFSISPVVNPDLVPNWGIIKCDGQLIPGGNFWTQDGSVVAVGSLNFYQSTTTLSFNPSGNRCASISIEKAVYFPGAYSSDVISSISTRIVSYGYNFSGNAFCSGINKSSTVQRALSSTY